jgi:hypothetical protein
MLCKEQPSVLRRQRGIVFMMVFAGILMARWVSVTIGGDYRILIGALLAGSLVGVGGIIDQSFLTERLRPFFRAYVEQHKDRFGSAA